MPILVYECQECGKSDEILVKSTPDEKVNLEYCDECDKVTEQVRQPTHTSFRGNFR